MKNPRYDFAIFGFMAVEIGKNFFGSASETMQLIATFAVFGRSCYLLTSFNFMPYSNCIAIVFLSVYSACILCRWRFYRQTYRWDIFRLSGRLQRH
jgi:hypothetical protein